MKTFFSAIFRESISPATVLVLSILITATHASDLVDFGLTAENLSSLFAWQFCHRFDAHFLVNMFFVVLLIRSSVRISLFDMITLSLYALAMTNFTPLPWYGASGIIHFYIGYIIRERLYTETFDFPWAITNISLSAPLARLLPRRVMGWVPQRIAYFNVIFLHVALYQFAINGSVVQESLHLFALLLGMCPISTIIEHIRQPIHPNGLQSRKKYSTNTLLCYPTTQPGRESL